MSMVPPEWREPLKVSPWTPRKLNVDSPDGESTYGHRLQVFASRHESTRDPIVVLDMGGHAEPLRLTSSEAKRLGRLINQAGQRLTHEE